MLENLEKVQSQAYIDTLEKTMRGFPGANQDQITEFKAYLDRKAAAKPGFRVKALACISKKPYGLRSNTFSLN